MLTRHIIKLVAMFTAILLLGGSPRVFATEYQTVNSGWLLESARNLILTSEPWAGTDCTVDLNGSPVDIIVYRSGRIDVRAVLERSPYSVRDIGAVNVDIHADGELYMRFDPTPWLLVTMPVFEAASDIDRGHILSESDITETRVDVRILPSSDIYVSLDEITGMAARTNIQGGRILTDGMLEPPTMVIRGETVLVCIPIGSASVTLHGVALDSGAVGDEIRVRNPDSGTIVTATVTGPSTASILIL